MDNSNNTNSNNNVNTNANQTSFNSNNANRDISPRNATNVRITNQNTNPQQVNASQLKNLNIETDKFNSQQQEMNSKVNSYSPNNVNNKNINFNNINNLNKNPTNQNPNSQTTNHNNNLHQSNQYQSIPPQQQQFNNNVNQMNQKNINQGFIQTNQPIPRGNQVNQGNNQPIQNQININQSNIQANPNNFYQLNQGQNNNVHLNQNNIQTHQNNNSNNANTQTNQNNNSNQNVNQMNMNYNNSNNTNQNNIQNSQQGDYLQIMNKSQNLYLEANELSKNFCFTDAIINYEESISLAGYVKTIITDNNLITRIDEFIRNMKKCIEFCDYQNSQKFNYKAKAGFAQKNDIKVDYLNCLRYDDDYNKKTKQTVTNKNNVATEKPSSQNDTDKGDKETSKSKDNKNDKDKSELENKIMNEIIDTKPGIKFSDIYGLDVPKQALKEIIILPTLRPDLFTGLRAPPRGLLLFGPPGTGKTMIAKAVATECKCTFFSISASSLTSKYLGDSEKLVRSLFDLANEKQPSIVFIDEIDSILSKRSDNENEASKRLKTEFLVQFDGVGSDPSKKVLIVGATNRPYDLDHAVLRRLAKRIYIGPFNKDERARYIKETMKTTENSIEDKEYEYIANLTSNYSNSDLKELCREAACEPIRDIKDLSKIAEVDKLRPVVYNDFLKATKSVRGTLTKELLDDLEEWNKTYGAVA